MRHALLVLALAGCPGPETDTDPDTDTDADSDSDTDSDTTLTGAFFGTVVDDDGSGLAGLRVNMCRTACFTVTTDANGDFEYEGLELQTYSLHVEAIGDETLSDPQVPYTISDVAGHELDIVMPGVGAHVALPATRGEIEAAAGLFFNVQQGDLTVLFEDDPTHMAGALVEEVDRLPLQGLAGTVLAVWYPEPWSATPKDGLSGFPVRITDSWGSSGDVFELWVANYDDVEWQKVGDFTSDGTSLTSSSELAKIETLVLVDPD